MSRLVMDVGRQKEGTVEVMQETLTSTHVIHQACERSASSSLLTQVSLVVRTHRHTNPFALETTT